MIRQGTVLRKQSQVEGTAPRFRKPGQGKLLLGGLEYPPYSGIHSETTPVLYVSRL